MIYRPKTAEEWKSYIIAKRQWHGRQPNKEDAKIPNWMVKKWQKKIIKKIEK